MEDPKKLNQKKAGLLFLSNLRSLDLLECIDQSLKSQD